MELIGLLAIGIVVGIPLFAIVALVRSRAAERQIEESWYKISDLPGVRFGLFLASNQTLSRQCDEECGGYSAWTMSPSRIKMVRINRSGSIDNLAFTAAVTVASRAFILSDRFLGRVKRVPLEDHPYLKISRRSILSGKQVLDAVFVDPVGKPARAAVLLCHGIGETVEHWFGVQRLLGAQGIASLVFDYSGYGRSTGHIQWKQCEQDAIEAFGVLKVLLPDTPASILGFSLGSGIAAAVLDCVSPQKLVLCSAFTSFRDAACCAGLPRVLSFLSPPIWNSEESLRRCSLPVLVLHCDDDRLFPSQMALKLASVCGERARLVIVPNQRHNDPFDRPLRQYWDHVVSILVSDDAVNV